MPHVPVLLQEVVHYLNPKPGGKYIDATVGSGGHAQEIIRQGAIVLGIDRDPTTVVIASPPRADEAIPERLPRRFTPRNDRLKVVHGNFADLKLIAEENGFAAVEGILFDLGMSSMQLDDPTRGFSFQREGPLDMRYNRSGERKHEIRNTKSETKTAADIVNTYPEKELTRIFYEYGEERRFGKKIARAIVEERKVKRIPTTTGLFELIKHALPGKFRFKAGDVARKIFQAIRIEVNSELTNLEKALPQAMSLLEHRGRLVVISFHSLEDRIVKRFFVREARNCVCPPEFPVCSCEARASLRILTKKPVTASIEETKINSRSKSAKLRAAERL